MTLGTLGLEAALVFVSLIVLHLLVCHLSGRLYFVLKAFAALAVALAASTPWVFSDGLLSGLFVWWLAVSLWVVYMVALISAQNSVTLRIMSEIAAAPSQPLPLEQLGRSYSDTDAVRSRLEAMARNGLLELRADGQVKALAKARRLAGVTLALRKILSIKGSG